MVPRTRRAAYVAFHNVGTAAGVFAGAMLGPLLESQVLPPGTVLLDDRSRSSLLYLFVFSGACASHRRPSSAACPRAAQAAPEMTAQALVMRITGFNAALGVIYDFIGRVPQPETDDADARDAGAHSAGGEENGPLGDRERAGAAKSDDNA